LFAYLFNIILTIAYRSGPLRGSSGSVWRRLSVNMPNK